MTVAVDRRRRDGRYGLVAYEEFGPRSMMTSARVPVMRNSSPGPRCAPPSSASNEATAPDSKRSSARASDSAERITNGQIAAILGRNGMGKTTLIRSVAGLTPLPKKWWATREFDKPTLEPLLGNPAARFRTERFVWIGTPTSYADDAYLLVVRSDSRFKTIEDARRRETILATATTTSTASFYGRLLNQVLGTKLKLIPGYNGATPAFLAMERGEISGRAGARPNSTVWRTRWMRRAAPGLRSSRSSWAVRASTRRALLQSSNRRPSALRRSNANGLAYRFRGKS